jgi:hypothetical protein
MAEPQEPKQQSARPEEEDAPEREAGDRPEPPPGHVGNLPEEEPIVGNPFDFPPDEPRQM